MNILVVLLAGAAVAHAQPDLDYADRPLAGPPEPFAQPIGSRVQVTPAQWTVELGGNLAVDAKILGASVAFDRAFKIGDQDRPVSVEPTFALDGGDLTARAERTAKVAGAVSVARFTDAGAWRHAYGATPGFAYVDDISTVSIALALKSIRALGADLYDPRRPSVVIAIKPAVKLVDGEAGWAVGGTLSHVRSVAAKASGSASVRGSVGAATFDGDRTFAAGVTFTLTRLLDKTDSLTFVLDAGPADVTDAAKTLGVSLRVQASL